MRDAGTRATAGTPRVRTAVWWAEAAGAVADLGVFVPIAVGLIVLNGMSPTATLLPAAALYLAVARIYRLPVAVQPLKAFGAIAIAIGADASVIAAGALLMGITFTVLGATGAIDTVARWIPGTVIRGVQLTVAVLLAKVGVGLILSTPSNFAHQLPTAWSAPLAIMLLLGFWKLRGRLALVAVAAAILGIAIAALQTGDLAPLGPSALHVPTFDAANFFTAATLLVLPQLPLTFANSCLAPADAARAYFGDRAARVTPGRLATTLGLANLFAASITGMPVCHGAGGLSAHYAFGARTWRAPAIMGGALLAAAVGFGGILASALPAFPVAVLAALLGVSALTHAQLLKDVAGIGNWVVVCTVAALGVFANLAWGVGIGLLVARLMTRSRQHKNERTSDQGRESQ